MRLASFITALLITYSCGIKPESMSVLNSQSNTMSLVKGKNKFSSIEQKAEYQIFTTSENSNYCYRGFKLYATRGYLVATAAKRQGVTKTNTNEHRRPHRMGSQELVDAKSCADEATSIPVMKIAKIKQYKGLHKLKWSSEIVIGSSDVLLDKVTTTTSRHFDPVIYDYMKRFIAGKFSKGSTYRACYEDGNDCEVMKNKYAFDKYLEKSWGLKSSGKRSKWLSNRENVLKLITSFSATGGFAFQKDGKSYLNLLGFDGFTTLPHSAKNMPKYGDLIRKPTAATLDLDGVWTQVEDNNYTNIIENNIEYQYKFAKQLTGTCRANFMSAVNRPEYQGSLNQFVNALRAIPTFNTKHTHGVDHKVSVPRTFEEALAFIEVYIHRINPADDLNRISTTLDINLWKESIKSLYEESDDVYSDVELVPLSSEKRAILNKSSWTRKDLEKIHASLDIAIKRDRKSTSIAMKRHHALLSIYNRYINIRANYFSRQLKNNTSSNNLFTSNYTAIFARGAKYRDFVKLSNGKTAVFGSGVCSYAVNNELMSVESGFEVKSMNIGTERAYANIGKVNNKDVIYISARKNVPNLTNNSTFDLRNWTRALSVSYDSGQTFSSTEYIRPEYSKNILTASDDVPSIVEHGFISSEVKSSIMSIPNFLGKGNPLVIHAHPSNATYGFIKGNPNKKVACLGGSGGDATKSNLARCDYRMNMTLTVGKRNSRIDAGEKLGAAEAVKWHFSKDLLVNKGSSGYSSLAHIGNKGCDKSYFALMFEGRLTETPKYRGFNENLNVQIFEASQGKLCD